MGVINKIKQFVGEMYIPFTDHRESSNSIRVNSKSHFSGYSVDDTRVDYKMARKLYGNTAQDYKLGAAFIKPIINSTVGFMGTPQFRSEDEEAQEVLNNFMLNNTSKLVSVQSNTLKLGDYYIWITREQRSSVLYPEESERLIYNIIPPEQVKEIIKNPINNEVEAYILESVHRWEDLDGNRRQATVRQEITAEARTVKIDGDTIPGLKNEVIPNNWGFIPIVHFRNEPDEISKFGKSEIEPVLPYVKMYHDILEYAAKSSKMHSNPKLVLKLKDVTGFIRNNLGISDPKEFIEKGGSINLDGHEVLFLSEEDNADMVEVKSATGDSQVLLKVLFYCIVDISETPEFIFGVHTPSALASVKEQMPIMINKIKRKREQFTEQWQLLARMILAIEAQVSGVNFTTNEVTILWDEIDARDEEKLSNTLRNTTEALKVALDSNIISREAAAEYLASLVDTMNDYNSTDSEVVGERERIIRDRRLSQRLEDKQGWIDEIEEIEDLLAVVDELEAQQLKDEPIDD